MAKRKRAKSKKSEKKEDFFVALNNPKPIRIALLENTKKILEAGKSFHELKLIRKQKMEEKKLLRKQVRQVTIAINKIRSTIPTVAIPIVEDIPTKKQPQSKTVKEPKQDTPKLHLSELDRIENELASIESKLEGLQ